MLSLSPLTLFCILTLASCILAHPQTHTQSSLHKRVNNDNINGMRKLRRSTTTVGSSFRISVKLSQDQRDGRPDPVVEQIINSAWLGQMPSSFGPVLGLLHTQDKGDNFTLDADSFLVDTSAESRMLDASFNYHLPADQRYSSDLFLDRETEKAALSAVSGLCHVDSDHHITCTFDKATQWSACPAGTNSAPWSSSRIHSSAEDAYPHLCYAVDLTAVH
ncbi:hypothetical protein EMMF5_004795 [Cystobasidiomycetes sp. EMM_F5]